MADFSMKIAGHVGLVHSIFDSTRDYCKAYLTGEAPHFEVCVTREDMAFEQAFLDREADEEGLRRRVFSDPFLERAALQRKFADHLLTQNTLLFHGSAVAKDGMGFVFTAACGTGKSTHTKYWCQEFPDAQMVNDDKPFLQLTHSGILVCGAPWSGKHGLDSNIAVPLQGICILERGQENVIAPTTPDRVMDILLHAAVPPTDPTQLPRFRHLAEELARRTRLWHMCCTKDPAAAHVAFDAMAK